MINAHLYLRNGWKPKCHVCGKPITEQQTAVSHKGYFGNGNQGCTIWFHTNCTRDMVQSLTVDLNGIDRIAHNTSTEEAHYDEEDTINRRVPDAS